MAKRNVALFIDAENMLSSLAGAILDEAMRHGFLSHRGIYGDFSRPSLAPWLEAAPRYALTACQTVTSPRRSAPPFRCGCCRSRRARTRRRAAGR